MRTTLTLDEDVAARLKAEARQSGQPFKQIVNEMLRRGLSSRAAAKQRTPFRIEPQPMGLRPGLSYDSTSELLEQLEGADHK